MIKLENISVDEVVYYNEDTRIKKLIKEMEVFSIKDVMDLFELYSEYDWSSVKQNIESVKKVVDKYNKRDVKPVIFPTREYEDRTLYYTDSQNSASVLLLGNPTYDGQTQYRGLNIYNIEQLKRNLMLTKKTGVNSIMFNVRNIGKDSIKNILDAIEMYTTQVERQAKLTKYRDINVFKYNSLEKKEIVNDKYKEIIEYLLENSNELIWGKLTDRQRNFYESSILNNKKIDKLIKERMIENISNYTTLDELNDIFSNDYKVLKRFIKK